MASLAVIKGYFKLVKFKDNGELFLYKLTIEKKKVRT